MVAVITADVVNSTGFSRVKVAQWLTDLINMLTSYPDFDWLLPPEIYRGDSFQGVLKSPENALKVAIMSRALFRIHDEKTDLRIAIGIGKGEEVTDRAGTSDGEAFRLSGHLADNIKSQKARIGVALPTPAMPLHAALDLLETVVENWTVSQSEVVAGVLQRQSLTQIAERLSVSQSAVSQRLSASKWWAVNNFLEAFPEQIALYAK
jgi:hypothetical protein